MQSSTVASIVAVPQDVKKAHIWELARCPATMALVCKEWHRISEAWFNKINQEIIKENPTLVACYEKVKGSRPCVVLFKQLVWALKHTETYLLEVDDPSRDFSTQLWPSSIPPLKITDLQCLEIPRCKATIDKVKNSLTNNASQYQHIIEKFVVIVFNPMLFPGADPSYITMMRTRLISSTITSLNNSGDLPERGLLRLFRNNIGILGQGNLMLFETLVLSKGKVFICLPNALYHFWPTIGNLNQFPYELKEKLPVHVA